MWARRLTLVVGTVLITLAVLRSYPAVYDRFEVPAVIKNYGPDGIPAPEVSTFTTNKEIIALVFCGRKDRLAVLDCYLKRNLRSNGGLLDKVRFVMKTDIPEDIEYIETLVSENEVYDIAVTDSVDKGFSQLWTSVEKGKYYVKIDDDVTFIEDGAIAQMIALKEARPDILFVSANLINNPDLAWVHYRIGAVLPFLPEVTSTPPKPPKPPTDWRISTLPNWTGPKNFTFNQTEPYGVRHRWLPRPGHIDPNNGTPIAEVEYNPWGTALFHWTIAAQQHYTLLAHLEESSQLSPYSFPNWEVREGISINFLLIWGDDIVDTGEVESKDEPYLTVKLPKKLGRKNMVAAQARVAHYSFVFQRSGLEETDILDRYKLYAEEKVCAGKIPP